MSDWYDPDFDEPDDDINVRPRSLSKRSIIRRATVNFMHLITMLQTGYTTIKVSFYPVQGGTRLYTYKTRDKCEEGDIFVVEGPSGLALVYVVEVHDSPKIDPSKPYVYKWTVQKVDRRAYDAQVESESAAVKMMEDAERKKAKDKTLDDFMANLPADSEHRERVLKALAEATGQSTVALLGRGDPDHNT